MIVTPRDAVIADYAIRSYAKIRGLDFRLLVYSNYLLPEQKAYYFPRWEQLLFVDLARNAHHDADLVGIGTRVNEERLEGPFEYCDPIWDRELRPIPTDYVATVDADFEILRSRFVRHMMERLRAEPDLVGMSTDYSPTAIVYEPYIGNSILLNERNHTWFCIYKRRAFEASSVSQAFHRESLSDGPVDRSSWDSCAYFQKSLRDQGLRLDHLHGRFRREFIHYGAFSKNTSVTRESVATFRMLAIVENTMPRRFSGRFRQLRTLVLPKLENNRYQWVREAPIRW
jgi:hypothetical protein